MTNLQFYIRLLCQLYELAAFVHRVGKRFFNKNMLAFPYGLFTNFKMKICWSNYINCVRGSDQHIFIKETGQLIFFGNFFGCVIIRVIKPYQIDSLNLFPVVQVKFAKVSNSKDADL